MKSIFISCFILSLLFIFRISAQVDARMLQYPDVSKTHISFTYAGDIWVVAKEGGTAYKLTSAKGVEGFAKFSPDGSLLAFSGNYDGNTDVYVIPTLGGLPKRITHHGMTDRIVDWYPDGKNLLFSSSRESGKQRFNQFYKVSKDGGLAEKLPLPYAEFGSISPDGKKIAFTTRTRVFRTWKRYLGGMAADIYIFDLDKMTSENISNNTANDEIPMWKGNKIYFLSDRDKNQRYNIWVYDISTKQNRQLTFFDEFDVHFPSIGENEIVFEAGGLLYLLDLSTEKIREVKVNVVTDGATLLAQNENVEKLIQNFSVSYNGSRALFEARGEIFSVPAENGAVINLTQSSAAAERFPSWSPNGKYVAYFSDKTGEYQLTIRDIEKPGEEKALTSFDDGFRYNIYWSPDSKKLVFIDQAMRINLYDMSSDKLTQVDKQFWYYEGGLRNFSVSWSSDSRYFTYGKDQSNRASAIAIYDTKEGKLHQVTNGFYSDSNPVFDPDGKYLYFTTNRNFNPVYSDFDNTWIYPNSTLIAAVTLSKETPSPLFPKNDSLTVKKDEESKTDEKKSDEKKDEKKVKEVKIDFDSFEERIVILPPAAGNYGSLSAVSGKVIFHKAPNSGSADKKKPIMFYDLDKREEKTIVDDADAYQISADGKKILVANKNSYSIVDVAPDQKLDKKLPTNQLEMTVVPKEEWKQIFNDVWRLERDFFYDKNMHGVDWKEMKKRYGALVDNAVTRSDVNYIIGELIAELNASHTYRGGGDDEIPLQRAVGYLGIDWELNNGAYRIKRIVKGASWETEVRSPLMSPGIKAKEGDYILAVNGVKIDVTKDPSSAFEGLADKTVELTINNKPSTDGAWTVVVKTLSDETRLRNLEWIESNRKRVDEATDGKIGYIYVPSTGIDGQTELVRQFYAQFNKQGLIIDERFNNGGQIPDRFIELLDRKPLAFWAVRDGANWQWPTVANFGPKVMLINGWSGSGGDAFPDYFRKAKLGPLVGARTWGGLIGITGAPTLIDGGSVTVPTFRMYDPDGKWFKEGHGVDPDIEVPEDPGMLAKGVDVQLERAIQEVLRLLKENPPVNPKQPEYEKR
ncbi:Periplasmic protease [Ignavibacterium album JCM 16511]|uniref:Tricorn protease homolog n=1 Tax=Ignavibacterium album (strain DSM 19864 / JCM 16511 / NBRC 101810 / Mat9-16) TaxID=945713 RepID=I0APA8_IGNAJ|nr:S41 family peptidase [Ignavibacterium album]AFH50815.1 Periplasmic protease [Ignavibacterium album JCM 16511]